MSKYRYRESWGGGVTNKSLAAFDAHLSKIGDAVSVKGYLYSGKNKVKQVAVMIVGTKGTLRLGGLSWGYSGQGVRGTKQILEKLKTPQDKIEEVIKTPWDGWKGNPRVIWKITL